MRDNLEGPGFDQLETELDDFTSSDATIQSVVNNPRKLISSLKRAFSLLETDVLLDRRRTTAKISSVMRAIFDYLNQNFELISKKERLLYSTSDFEFLKKSQIFIKETKTLTQLEISFSEEFFSLGEKISNFFDDYLHFTSNFFHMDRLNDLEWFLIYLGFFYASAAHKEMLEKKSNIPEQLAGVLKIDEEITNIEKIIREKEAELELLEQKIANLSAGLDKANAVLCEYERLLPISNIFFKYFMYIHWFFSLTRICQNRWALAKKLLFENNYPSRENLDNRLKDIKNGNRSCLQKRQNICYDLQHLRKELSDKNTLKYRLLTQISKERETNERRCQQNVERIFLFHHKITYEDMIARCFLLEQQPFFKMDKQASFFDPSYLFNWKRFIDELCLSRVFLGMFDSIRLDAEVFLKRMLYKFQGLIGQFFLMTTKKRLGIEFYRPIITSYYIFLNQFKSKKYLSSDISGKIKTLGFELYESVQSHIVFLDLDDFEISLDLLRRLIFVDDLMRGDFFFCLWKETLSQFNLCVKLCFEETRSHLFSFFKEAKNFSLSKDDSGLVQSLEKLCMLKRSDRYRKEVLKVFQSLVRYIDDFIESMESDFQVLCLGDISPFSVKLFSRKKYWIDRCLLDITSKLGLERVKCSIVDVVSRQVMAIDNLIAKKIATAFKFLDSFYFSDFYQYIANLKEIGQQGFSFISAENKKNIASLEFKLLSVIQGHYNYYITNEMNHWRSYNPSLNIIFDEMLKMKKLPTEIFADLNLMLNRLDFSINQKIKKHLNPDYLSVESNRLIFSGVLNTLPEVMYEKYIFEFRGLVAEIDQKYGSGRSVLLSPVAIPERFAAQALTL